MKQFHFKLSEETKVTGIIFVIISVLVVLVLVAFLRPSSTDAYARDPICIDTLDKKWELCEDHGEKYGCMKYCGHTVVMKKGRLTFVRR